MIEVIKTPTANDAAAICAKLIQSTLTQWVGEDSLILFSGGSPLEVAKLLDASCFHTRTTLGVSDERFSEDPQVNNFAQLVALPWYPVAIANGAKSIDTRPLPQETYKEAGERFNRALKHWRELYPTGKIIITQGIGLDGHTAGMMPYPEDPQYFQQSFVETKSWAVGYDAKGKNSYPLRVTTTVPFLLAVDVSVVYVCGEDKKKPLEAVLSSSEQIASVPGRMLHKMKHCLLYTDLSVDRVDK